MTDHPIEDDSQIVEDVLPLPTDELAVPVELKKLQPWHRPRKQYIRENQWLLFAKRLINREKGTPAFRFLTKVNRRFATSPYPESTTSMYGFLAMRAMNSNASLQPPAS